MSETTHRPPYGAEHLKALASKHTLAAAVFSSLLITFLFLIPIIQKWLNEEESSSVAKVKAKKVINYAELSAPPPIDLEKVEPEKPKPKIKVKTVKFLQPVAKKDEEVADEEIVPSMDEMETTQIGTFDQDGVDSIMIGQDDLMEIEVNPAPAAEPYTYVQIMPEFIGGEQELMNYLSENTSYPEIAKDADVEGTVYIGFVIEPDGSITNAKLLRGVHPQLDKEALSVISNMPKWKPGQQNGLYVRVSYTIPFRFYLDKR